MDGSPAGGVTTHPPCPRRDVPDIVLRDYQSLCLATLRERFVSGGKAPLVVMPTGAGKTVVGIQASVDEVAAGGSAVFVAPRSLIVEQTSDALDRAGIEHGVLMGAHWREIPDARIQVATTQTLLRRDLRTPPSLFIFDEAHAFRDGIHKIQARNPQARYFGLSATPFRYDGKGLRSVFDSVIVGETIQGLIARALIVPPRVFAPSAPDVSGVAVRHGEFDQRQLARVVEDGALMGDIVQHWKELAKGLPTVVFAVSIAHSRHIVQRFVREGIAAEHIDGSMPIPQRKAILDRLGRETTIVVSCGVLSEGWDCPRVMAGILARPTQSLALYIQQVGRLLRPYPGKTEAIVLDHGGNTIRHGFVTDRWSVSLGNLTPLEAKKAREARARRGATFLTCPTCSAVSPPLTLVCRCGYAFPADDLPVEKAGHLIEAVPEEGLPVPAPEQTKAVWAGMAPPEDRASADRVLWIRLCNTAASRSLRRVWAATRFRAITGRAPPETVPVEVARVEPASASPDTWF